MTLQDLKTQTDFATLVTFEWPNQIRAYTNWTEDQTIGGLSYAAQPSITITYPEMDGGVEDKVVKVRCSTDIEPVNQLLNGDPFPELEVLVAEIVPGDDSTLRVNWFGDAAGLDVNVVKNERVAELTISGLKSRFADWEPGIAATQYCPWLPYEKPCNAVDPAADSFNGVVQTATGSDLRDMQLTFTGSTPSLVDRRWRRGYVTGPDGLKILIRGIGIGSRFKLARRLPRRWLGQTVTITPGCDGLRSTCEFEYGNLSQFGGFGLNMRNVNPLVEGGE